ncbi:HNH endonuclease [Bradyrhizobium prioriisuperbiae]|uniref:HNH endonuclease n=1 Tax=Bradyrhizobium prioriisuperbiae TaxID=2854389 RepID=UPI0038996D03
MKPERAHFPSSVAEFLMGLVETETWRPISWAPNYSVSSWGNIQGPRALLQPAEEADYPHVSIVVGEETKTARVHRLVANAFLGPPPFAGAMVAHNDGNTSNCRVDNLRWASGLENQKDRARHGTRICGSAVIGAKLVESDIPKIRSRIASGERYPSIARDFGVSVSTISLVKKNRTWRSVPSDAREPAE